MSLETLFKLLSAARFSIAVGVFGLLLNLGGANGLLKRAGTSLAFMGVGAAATTMNRKDRQISRVGKLQASHNRREAALRTSIDTAMSDAIKAKQWAQEQASVSEQAQAAIAQLQRKLEYSTKERDRLVEETHNQATQLTQMSASLTNCHSDRATLVDQLEWLQKDRNQLLGELYDTAIAESKWRTDLTRQVAQNKQDLHYQLTQKKKLKSEVVQARATFHTEITEAYERISSLESALANKTETATAMLTELEKEATDAFSQLSGQANAQKQLIQQLTRQIEALKEQNTALTFRRFDEASTDDAIGNRLIDYLAERNMAYSAFSHLRDAQTGRLKVTLNLVRTTLKQARDSLSEMEAALNLWEPPSVTIHGGRHIFTLAVERSPVATHSVAGYPSSNNLSAVGSPANRPSASCPRCTTVSSSVKDSRPNARGKIKFWCENAQCMQKSFSAKP